MTFRSITASLAAWSALASLAFILVGAEPRMATAQESEQPGLFGGLFGGNDRSREERPREPRGGYAQMDAGDLTIRLDRLEGQIRQLTGSIEQLQFRNQQLEQQVKRQQEDVEFRFQELSGKPGAARTNASPAAAPPARAAAPPPSPSAQPVPSAAGRRSDAFDPNEHPNAPGAPRAMGAVSGPPPVVAQDQVGARGGREAGAPLDLSTLSERAASDPSLDPDRNGSSGSSGPDRVASVPQSGGQLPPPPPRNPNATPGSSQQAALPPSATPRDEFALAQGYVQRKEYAQAEEGFRDFIKKHPNDRLIADANFWLGETFYQRQRYRDAAEAFLNVSTKHESSGKAPDSLMRLGQSLAALGEKEAACATFGELGRKFPNASNGVKQGVAREQKRVKC